MTDGAPPREKGVRRIMKKRVPRFASEDRERDFWARADSTQYVDWTRGSRAVLPALKPSLTTISLRLPDLLLAELKLLANKRDVPYQSLLKVFLAERIREELRASRQRRGKSEVTPQRLAGVAQVRDRSRVRPRAVRGRTPR
jgi:predicted DNA binding CopG/RHH family protein